MVYAQTGIHPKEWDAQNSMGFCDKNKSPNPGQTTIRSDSLQKERTYRPEDFAVSAGHRVKIKENEKKKKIQILRSLQRTKKAMEHEGDGDTNCNWCTRNDLQRISKRTRGVGNLWTNGDYPNYSIV